MRTLALLAALLLLALRGQAGPLAEPADRRTEAEDPLPTQAQDGAEDPLPAQAQDGAEDQAVTISFEGAERPARDIASPSARATCYCRAGSCNRGEYRYGTCTYNGRQYLFCCK